MKIGVLNSGRKQMAISRKTPAQWLIPIWQSAVYLLIFIFYF